MTALMVQGVSSWAGKSLVATALVRFFHRRGVRVAPFKGQNMSNNARVVDGGEIGVAQYLQALAAGLGPDVRMNPVLVKPEGDQTSQVIVDGRPDHALGALPWRERGPYLWAPIEHALASLLAEYELVVIEGAGSPAEINLLSTDLANMRVARAANAPVVLVADIDRGGAFAHLYGTWALVEERDAIAAFVLNKFRGDPSLLPPGPEDLERLTGVPVIGTLPWLEHGLPDEDGAAQRSRADGRRPVVGVVRYPTASNLDEFRALEQAADVVFVRGATMLAGLDLLVLPGSKHVPTDLAWLRSRGFAEALGTYDGRVLGICGGLELLGREVGGEPGLGLLDLTTAFAEEKLTERAEVAFGPLPPPWEALSGKRFAGYEIRHGRLEPDRPYFVRDSVLGVIAHGILESRETVRALLGVELDHSLDAVFDELADAVEEHLDTERLVALAGVA
jgi:adenosylcobyric acid synthase